MTCFAFDLLCLGFWYRWEKEDSLEAFEGQDEAEDGSEHSNENVLHLRWGRRTRDFFLPMKNSRERERVALTIYCEECENHNVILWQKRRGCLWNGFGTIFRFLRIFPTCSLYDLHMENLRHIWKCYARKILNHHQRMEREGWGRNLQVFFFFVCLSARIVGVTTHLEVWNYIRILTIFVCIDSPIFLDWKDLGSPIKRKLCTWIKWLESYLWLISGGDGGGGGDCGGGVVSQRNRNYQFSKRNRWKEKHISKPLSQWYFRATRRRPLTSRKSMWLLFTNFSSLTDIFP